VMLDTSRNWFGKEAILKVSPPFGCDYVLLIGQMLDTMSMVKVSPKGEVHVITISAERLPLVSDSSSGHL